MSKYVFSGPLAQQINLYLEERIIDGKKITESEKRLKRLDEMSHSYNSSKSLEKDFVLEYILRKPHWSQRTQQGYISEIRQFAKFLVRQGISAYICENNIHFKTNNSFTPYIFNKSEIDKIFNAADSIPDSGKSKNAHLFYPVILRVLYSCGLRSSEAVNLRIKDIDLDKENVYIYNSKYKKDRILPISSSLVPYLKSYISNIHTNPNKLDYFFKSPITESKYNQHVVYSYFRKLLWQCGIAHGGRGSGPRLHDLRHTFCVHSFRQLIEANLEPDKVLPVLSAYMGHQSLSATSKYLRLTAELYPEIATKMEKHIAFCVSQVSIR